MEFNVGDLKEKSANHLKAETDLNTKTDKLSEKVDLGFNRLGDKMDKLSDDTHRLMGRADAIRGVNPWSTQSRKNAPGVQDGYPVANADTLYLNGIAGDIFFIEVY